MRRIAVLAAIAAVLAAAPVAAGAPSVLAKLPAGADARDVARDAGVTLARAFPQIGWAEFAVPGGDVATAREELLDDGRVFRLDWQRRGDAFETQIVPSDSFTATPGTIGGASTDWQWQLPRFFTAWDLGRGSAATRIAVLDSEIDTLHPELAGKVAGAYNAERQFAGTYQTANVRATDAQIAEANTLPNDNDLHGSHVAGLAGAATDNGSGVSGAGFDSALLPVKVTLTVPRTPQGDATYVANVVDGILWATDAGARVMNMSFGSGTYHQALADAVAYAVSRDVLPVAAAGNTQASAPGVPLYPAALPGVVAVGAVDTSGTITSFSTNGAYVDVSAPGVRILSTWDTRAPGQLLQGSRLTGYFSLSGTSMASPIVAGLGGLMRDLRPDLAADEHRVDPRGDGGRPGGARPRRPVRRGHHRRRVGAAGHGGRRRGGPPAEPGGPARAGGPGAPPHRAAALPLHGGGEGGAHRGSPSGRRARRAPRLPRAHDPRATRCAPPGAAPGGRPVGEGRNGLHHGRRPRRLHRAAEDDGAVDDPRRRGRHADARRVGGAARQARGDAPGLSLRLPRPAGRTGRSGVVAPPQPDVPSAAP